MAINFDAENHLKRKKQSKDCNIQNKRNKINDKTDETIETATDFDTYKDQSSDELDEINAAFIAPSEDQNALELNLNTSGLAIMRFDNPPRRNLCFSNVTASCLLNLLPIRKYLWKNRMNFKNKISIGSELFLISKHESDNPKSTKRLRAIVMQKCLKSGQTERKFNNNKLRLSCAKLCSA